MLPAVQVLGLNLPTAPLTVLFGTYLALWAAGRGMARLGESPDLPFDAATWGFVAGLATARLWYVAANWQAYRLAPGQIVSLNTGTLALGPGVAAALLAGLVYLRRRGKLSWAVADGFAPGLAVLAAVISLASLLSGSAYGQPTQLPWAVWLWEEWRHPTQAYQLGLDLLTLGGLLALRFRARAPGQRLLLTVAALALSRLLVEGLRADSVVLSGGFRRDQVVYLAVGLAALWQAMWRSDHEEEAAAW